MCHAKEESGKKERERESLFDPHLYYKLKKENNMVASAVIKVNRPTGSRQLENGGSTRCVCKLPIEVEVAAPSPWFPQKTEKTHT